MRQRRKWRVLPMAIGIIGYGLLMDSMPYATLGASAATYANAGPSANGCACESEGNDGCAEGLCNIRGFCTNTDRKAAACAGFDCSPYGGMELAWTVCDGASSSGLPICVNKGVFGYVCRTASGEVAGEWKDSGACACIHDKNCATGSSGAVCGLTGHCRNAVTGEAADCVVATGSSSSSGMGPNETIGNPTIDPVSSSGTSPSVPSDRKR